MTDSNCRPPPCKGDALPAELIAQKFKLIKYSRLKYIKKLINKINIILFYNISNVMFFDIF